MKPITVTMLIPFPGFYETDLSEELDRAEEMSAESIVEHGESCGLDVREVCDALYFTSNYSAAFQHVAQKYAEEFANFVNTETGTLTPFNFTFESMDSPKEYNFSTDRVYVTLSLEDFQRMYDRTDRAIFARIVRDTFTSRSGFASFYSNDAEVWHKKSLATWDHNEAGTLLRAYLLTHVEDIEENSVEGRICAELSSDGVFDAAFDSALDWEALQTRLKEQVAAKSSK